jgi:uncharacterized membrane protein required for colicin V production
MSMDGLPFNAFDVFLVAVLIAGIYQGRKRGMSQELLNVIKWLAILLVCAIAYEPIGSLFGQNVSLFSKLSCYLIAYVGAALVIMLLFVAVKRGLGGKLTGSDLFGGAEYYLGMGSGLIRFACVLLVGLALLNARHYTEQEVKAEEAFQNDVYGSHYFPTLHSVQSVVFEKSASGPWIRDYLSFLLIKPTDPENKDLHQKEAKWGP